MCSTLNLLLPLPTPALPGSGAVVIGEWLIVSAEFIHVSLFTSHYLGLISACLSVWQIRCSIFYRSKARHPLRIMGQRYFFISNFSQLLIFKGAQEAARFGFSISDLFVLAKAELLIILLSVG